MKLLNWIKEKWDSREFDAEFTWALIFWALALAIVLSNPTAYWK